MKRIYGKDRPLGRLLAFTRSGRFPHALLFCGKKGVGRGVLADYAAALLLCERGGEKPCGECTACRKVEAHIHPDVIYPLSESENGKYTVEQLRGLIADCYKSPNDGAVRVCVFENIDEMSALCQNTLLKFIEEPLPFNRCLFTAEKLGAVLETVRSRVTVLDVDEADREGCLAALSDHGIGRGRAEELYGLFGGNIGKCLDGADDEGKTALMKTASDIAEALYAGKEYDCAVSFSALKTREEIGEVLALLSDVFASASVRLSGGTIRGALSAQAEKLAGRLRRSTASELYGAASELLSALDRNPNVPLFAAHCCERLFDTLEKGI